MNKTFLISIAVLMFSITPAFAQKTKTVTGEAVFTIPNNMTEKEARHKVLELARLNAMAAGFGIDISQKTSTIMRNANGRSDESFNIMENSEVCGKWLKTIEEKVTKEIVNGETVLHARVKGKAQENKSAKVTFEVKTLRNGTEDIYENTDFNKGDRFYISFCTPVDGYLMVYLLDEKHNASRLIPVGEDVFCQVKRNQRHVFVDDPNNYLFLTCDGAQEINQLCIIFSPNKFYPGIESKNDTDESLKEYEGAGKKAHPLSNMSERSFTKWLSDLRRQDREVQVETKHIRIINPQSAWQAE